MEEEERDTLWGGCMKGSHYGKKSDVSSANAELPNYTPGETPTGILRITAEPVTAARLAHQQTHNGMLLIHTKWTCVGICRKMDGPGDHDVKQNQSWVWPTPVILVLIKPGGLLQTQGQPGG